MLEALKKNLGIISKACEAVGISRASHYKWCDEDPEYKQAVEEIKEYAIDFVESKLYACINDKNITAIIYYLKNQGRKRGWLNEYKPGKDGQQEEQFKVIKEYVWGGNDNHKGASGDNKLSSDASSTGSQPNS